MIVFGLEAFVGEQNCVSQTANSKHHCKLLNGFTIRFALVAAAAANDDHLQKGDRIK